MTEALAVGTPLWSDEVGPGGFGAVTWVSPTRVGIAFLQDGIPSIVGHAAIAAALPWAQRWRELRSQGLVVDVCGILESKG